MAAGEQPAQLPERLGEYEVRGVVGRGGMGVVYEAYQPAIGKRVAIKVLQREADDARSTEQLLDEARLVNAVEHRGLIQIFSFGTAPDGRPFLVMEYLSGRSLAEHLAPPPRPLPCQDVVQILDEVSSALAAAHKGGVIHRDLKPSNIFLVVQPDGSTYVKLLDFGLARRTHWSDGKAAQTSAAQVRGTPHYMSPEHIRAERLGPATDLYSLGVVAFEMLTGRAPFDGDSVGQLISAHLEQAPVAPSSLVPGVPPDLDHLVLSLLAKHPERRPASADEVRAQLKFIRAEHHFSASTRWLLPPTARGEQAPAPHLKPVAPQRPTADPAPLTQQSEPPAHADPAAPPADVTGPVPPPPPPGDWPAAKVAAQLGEAPRVTAKLPDPVVTVKLARPDQALRLWLRVGPPLLALLALAVWALKVDSQGPPAPAPLARPVEASAVVAPEPAEPAPAISDRPEVPTADPPARPPPRRAASGGASRRRHALTLAAPDSPDGALLSRLTRVREAWARLRRRHSSAEAKPFDEVLDYCEDQLQRAEKLEATRCLDEFVALALEGREP